MPEDRIPVELLSELRQNLPAQLPSFLAGQRWFGGKARRILGIDIVDAIPVGGDERKTVVLLVTVTYLEGAEETYSIPLVTDQLKDAGDPVRKLNMGNGSGLEFRDAFSSQEFLSELLEIIERERELPGEKGRLRGFRAAAFSDLSSSSDVQQPKSFTDFEIAHHPDRRAHEIYATAYAGLGDWEKARAYLAALSAADLQRATEAMRKWLPPGSRI